MADNNNILSLTLNPLGGGWRTMRVLMGTVTTIAALYAPQTLVLSLAPTKAGGLPRVIHRTFCRLLGLEVCTLGNLQTEGPTLFVANHMSWLDIPVIGSQVKGSFVARADMQEWGIFKNLCGLQRTIFVERERRHSTANQRDQIIDRLAGGDSIILFPEGTTSSGNSMLPFKSSLFGVADAARKAGVNLKIQPITLAYTHLNNIPIGRTARQNIAWIGDEDLNPHFKRVMDMGRIRALLHYHNPVRLDDFSSRKALAQHCETVVGHSLRLANTGRLNPIA